MTNEKKWFAVRLLSEAMHPGERIAERLFEDSIMLVRSATLEEAREKAEIFGKKSDTKYTNPYKEVVTWRFREILDAKELLDDNVGDGIEVYFNHISEAEAEQVRRMLQPFES
ncbi:MAG TPA: DUF4288 domain-containing protein [Candidatus Acidoferrales bacterium]|nr:DUF4288 domain-containing protein [Candidatus Acidoferrales bacterium]